MGKQDMFGKLIEAGREKRGHTLEQMAAKLGITEAFARHMERTPNVPVSQDLAISVTKLYNLPVKKMKAAWSARFKRGTKHYKALREKYKKRDKAESKKTTQVDRIAKGKIDDDLLAFVRSQSGSFYESLKSQLEKYDGLTERQIEAVKNAHEAHKIENRVKPATPQALLPGMLAQLDLVKIEEMIAERAYKALSKEQVEALAAKALEKQIEAVVVEISRKAGKK